MPTLKQQTVSIGQQSQTVELVSLKNTMSRGGKRMYVIRDKDTGKRIVDPITNKGDAEREFRQTIEDIQRGMESAAKSNMDLGIGGGGSDVLGSSSSNTNDGLDDLL